MARVPVARVPAVPAATVPASGVAEQRTREPGGDSRIEEEDQPDRSGGHEVLPDQTASPPGAVRPQRTAGRRRRGNSNHSRRDAHALNAATTPKESRTGTAGQVHERLLRQLPLTLHPSPREQAGQVQHGQRSICYVQSPGLNVRPLRRRSQRSQLPTRRRSMGCPSVRAGTRLTGTWSAEPLLRWLSCRSRRDRIVAWPSTGHGRWVR